MPLEYQSVISLNIYTVLLSNKKEETIVSSFFVECIPGGKIYFLPSGL